MKLFGFHISRKADLTIDEVIRRLEAFYDTAAGILVTPENCEESPTVQAIVNSISLHFATLPIHVYQKKRGEDGREIKEALPNHSVAKLLSRPNAWQTRTEYWLDAASVLVRYGRFFAVKMQGVTGPIRSLVPVVPSSVTLIQDSSMNVRARITSTEGGQRDYEPWELHHVRNRSKDFLNGDSPVTKARESIALEIAALKFGAEFFGNGAMPGIMFHYAETFRGHQSKEQRDNFIESFQQAYGHQKRFKGMLLPHGIGNVTQIALDNERAQFLDTRKLQRNVIAGAFGVPPHLVGDLERGTFSNIEHQSQEFQEKVILPYARMFEDAMERDLLSDDDRRSGVVIRFNLDASLRADFKSRQEGLKIQREAGVISPNDWREREGMNPIPPDKGGDEYWQQGPSGQTGKPAGEAREEGNDDTST